MPELSSKLPSRDVTQGWGCAAPRAQHAGRTTGLQPPCTHVGHNAVPQIAASSKCCCVPGEDYYNNVAIKEQNKKRQRFAAQGPNITLSLTTNEHFSPPMNSSPLLWVTQCEPLSLHAHSGSHHPGCPLLLTATRADLQAEHPAASSTELGKGGWAQSRAVPAGGVKAAAAPPRCH